MSRAEKDRQQAMRELSQQLAKFQRDLVAGRTGMIDRFGVKVDRGDYVLYRPQHDLIFEVVDVVPVLNSPVIGAITLKLACTTDIQFMASQRAMSIVKCGEKAKDAEGQADLTPPGSEAPHEPPTDLPAPDQPPSQIDEPPAGDVEPPPEGDS